MYRTNVWPLFALGQAIGLLTSKASPGINLKELGPFLTATKAAIDGTFGLGTVGSSILPLSAKAIQDLNKILGGLLAEDRWADGTPLSEEEFGTLNREAENFYGVFRTEAPEIAIYQIPQRRGLDTRTLTDRADFSFAGKVRKSFSEEEIKDAREAGKCLAFDVPTAATFHMYRLMESVVLKYVTLFGIVLKENDRNLGNYIHILVERNVDTKITTMLKHIKDEYRNPAIHPGLFHTFDTAATQFAFVQGVIQMMVDDLLVRLTPDFVWPKPSGILGMLLDI